MVTHDAFSSSYHDEAGFACEMSDLQLFGLSFHGGGWCENGVSWLGFCLMCIGR